MIYFVAKILKISGFSDRVSLNLPRLLCGQILIGSKVLRY